MPSKAATPCKKAECNGLVKDGKCSLCGSVRRSNWLDKRRGTAHERGYGANWQKLRRMILAEHPLCVMCKAAGQVMSANEVDHILPKTQGGDDSLENLQPLCKRCHMRKTARDRMTGKYQQSMIPVTIVAGAPGSGKTTYVQEHRLWGDLVIDVDALFVALSGGLEWYDKPLNLLPFVLEARNAVLRRLSSESEVRRAWFITGEADIEKLRQLKEEMGAERLIVMDVGPIECYRRIASDERRKDKAVQQKELVNKWFSVYGVGHKVT